LDKVVAPVAAQVDPVSGEGDDYVRQALVPIGQDERDRVAELMGSARYTIDTRRFSDGYWSQTR